MKWSVHSLVILKEWGIMTRPTHACSRAREHPVKCNYNMVTPNRISFCWKLCLRITFFQVWWLLFHWQKKIVFHMKTLVWTCFLPLCCTCTKLYIYKQWDQKTRVCHLFGTMKQQYFISPSHCIISSLWLSSLAAEVLLSRS